MKKKQTEEEISKEYEEWIFYALTHTKEIIADMDHKLDLCIAAMAIIPFIALVIIFLLYMFLGG